MLTLRLLALSLALAGCGRDPRPEDIQPIGFTDDIALEVDNRNFSDVVIYLRREGTRTRIGEVTGSMLVTLMIPRSLLSGITREVQFQADPVGADRTITSYPVFIRPGEHVHLTIENNFRAATIQVVQ
jgi:hypothetical protein